MSFDPALLTHWLRCSKSKSPLVRHGDSLVCTDPACRLSFAIIEDIPNMLVEEAAELPVDAWTAAMQTARAM